MCDSRLGATKTLFDDIRGEFLLRQLRYLALEGVAKWVGKARLLEVNDVLKDIVAKGVLNEMKSAISDLANELGFLVTGSVVYTTLQHATAMTMGSNRHTVGANSVKDELPLVNQVPQNHIEVQTHLSIIGGKTIETFLNDMVAIQVLDEFHNLTVQSIDHGLYLLGRRNEFYHFLQSPRTVAI